MRDLVTPFAITLRRLEREDAVLIPEARLREAYRDTKIGRSVRDALARQLPVGVPREEVLFMRVPGYVLLVNPRNAASL